MDCAKDVWLDNCVLRYRTTSTWGKTQNDKTPCSQQQKYDQTIKVLGGLYELVEAHSNIVFDAPRSLHDQQSASESNTFERNFLSDQVSKSAKISLSLAHQSAPFAKWNGSFCRRVGDFCNFAGTGFTNFPSTSHRQGWFLFLWEERPSFFGRWRKTARWHALYEPFIEKNIYLYNFLYFIIFCIFV